MAKPSSPSSTFWVQADALLRKNLTYQKRNQEANTRLILFPMILCFMLAQMERKTSSAANDPANKCGCICTNNTTGDNCQKLCGFKYSNPYQGVKCEIPKPPEWSPLLQLSVPGPRPLNMFLLTAQNRSIAQSVSENMFPTASTTSLSVVADPMKDNNFISLDTLGTYVLGTSVPSSDLDNYYENGFRQIVYLQTQCGNDSFISLQLPVNLTDQQPDAQAECAHGIVSWRNSSSQINNELFKQDSLLLSDKKRTQEDILNEIVSAFDFLNSNGKKLNVTIWYNPFRGHEGQPPRNLSDTQPLALLRIPRYVNLISNAYLQFLRGPGTEISFDFVKEMPKHETVPVQDDDTGIRNLLFIFVILQLFPVAVTSMVYEKEKKLRIMMKMHGLGDTAYWMISYAYFVALSMIYVFAFVTYGSLLGLKFFTMNNYSIQFVFYMIYINLQISGALLMASLFSNVKRTTMIAYNAVLTGGIVTEQFFKPLIEAKPYSRGPVLLLELNPMFALYRGIYEFGEYSTSSGMQWKDVINDKANGMKEVLVILLVEWILVFFIAYFVDQVLSAGGGRKPLSFLIRFLKKPFSESRYPSIQRKLDEMEKPDVIQEKEKVLRLLQEPTNNNNNNHAIVCDDLKKVYSGKDGNPDKFAVRGLFLAVPRGECFGMLGPNGAGKTSFISMMIGLTKPSSGSAFVEGLDIKTEMDGIYTCMGFCPQHDLLWETLTGREHLLFYGRLKNLQGSVLTQAVEESLKSLNLFHGGVADKQCGKYSGGMKRRLSVAISLIGDPKVVYMDEPSTGLDPASRNCLWNVIRVAKKNRAIILTTHSMEEAEFLCDRLGIFVDGRLQCVGNPKELKGRYGGTYVFTISTSSNHEEDVENMVLQQLTPNANRIYCLSGTQKFELPKDEVRIADVFRVVDAAKRKFTVSAWGLADTKLEDVFIKVARGAEIFQT